MFSSVVHYFKWLVDKSQLWIETQLFAPTLSGAAATCRLSIGFACLLFFNFWYGNLNAWIGEGGPLNVETTRFLIGDGLQGTGAAFRLSPFFVWQSVWLQYAVLLMGTIASLVLMTGWGGRIVPIVVWLLMLCILHRIPMIQSQGEILLSCIVPYLAIDNGWLSQPNRVGFADDKVRWTSGFAVAMIRWHLIIWLSASFAGHLSQDMWSNGTAVWNIVVNQQSPFLSAPAFANSVWLSPLLGNIWLIVHFAFILCLIVRSLRPLAFVFGTLFWLGVYVLGGDPLYAIAGVAATSCIFYESSMLTKSIQAKAATS